MDGGEDDDVDAGYKLEGDFSLPIATGTSIRRKTHGKDEKDEKGEVVALADTGVNVRAVMIWQ